MKDKLNQWIINK